MKNGRHSFCSGIFLGSWFESEKFAAYGDTDNGVVCAIRISVFKVWS